MYIRYLGNLTGMLATEVLKKIVARISTLEEILAEFLFSY